MPNILKTAESGPGWPVISVITVGESTGECGSERLFFRHCSVCVLSIACHLSFFISLIWALIEFFYTFNGMLVNVPVGTAAASAVLMCETVWNIWLCQMDVSLRSHDVMRVVSFSSLFFPRGQFIIEGTICLSHISMDTVIDSTQPFWRLCAVCLHASFMSLSNFPLALCFVFFCCFLATSSTQLEDLSFLNNQRTAGHRGSVRKHNTAGRPSDDVKGILRLNVESRSMCQLLMQKHLTNL